MAGRGRGLEMTKPAWMTEATGGAPGAGVQTDSVVQSSSALPPGIGFSGGSNPNSEWTEHTAPNGRKYFFNRRTQESRWEKPPELVAAALAEEAQNWKEFMSPDGRKYYYNKVTRESKWTLPDEVLAAKQAAIARASASSTAPVQVVKLSESKKERSSGGGGGGSYQSKMKSSTQSKTDSAALAEGKRIFRELLESVNCKPGWTWDQVMRATVTDSRYGALSTLAEKKSCFNDFIEEMERERDEQQKERERVATKRFIELLDENPDITYSTRYMKARELIGDDERWNGLDDFRRESVFISHLREKHEKLVESRRQNRDGNIAAFKALLKNHNIKMTTTYKRACNKLHGLDDYEALDRLDRLEVYEWYVRSLEKKYYEEEEAREASQKRKDRKTREAFKDLLKSHVENGTINAKSRWREYYELIHKDEVFKAVERNEFGSRPRELFEDVIEELEEGYEKDRAIMKEVYRGSSIMVNLATTLEDFKEAMEKEDERMKEVNLQNLKIVYSELHYKAREREARESRRRKRAKEEFMSMLKRSQDISESTTWEQVKLLFSDRLDAKYEHEYEEVLQEYIAKLRRKEEKRKKKESAMESSSGEDHRRRRSTRRRRLRSSSESEEGLLGRRDRSRRYYSDDEMETERPSKRHKKEKYKRKRDRHEKDKTRSRHDTHRKKSRKARSVSPSGSLSIDRFKQEELSSPIYQEEEETHDVVSSKQTTTGGHHDREETGSVEEGEAQVPSVPEEGEAVESAEEGEV
eukprot:g4792.t1